MNPEQETNMLREEENELNLIDMYRVVRANWYWFLLSVAVCCAVAVLYLGWAPKIYQRTATVLIKDDTKGGGAASEAAVFEDLNMFNMKRSVDNELLVFKSKQLMKSVVKRLAWISVTAFVKGYVRWSCTVIHLLWSVSRRQMKAWNLV